MMENKKKEQQHLQVFSLASFEYQVCKNMIQIKLNLHDTVSLMNHVTLLWHTVATVICEPHQIPGWIMKRAMHSKKHLSNVLLLGSQ